MNNRLAPLLVLLIAIVAVGATGHTVLAQDVHRCVGSDGGSVYTDKVCADIGAIEIKPAVVSSGVQIHIRDCARSPDDLLFGVRSALDAQDVNKLAGFYQWAGVGSDESVHLMDRLEALSRRPLVDVALEGFETPPQALSSPTAQGANPRSGRSRPDRLRIEQTKSSESVAPVSTTFHLQQNFGCWWIQY